METYVLNVGGGKRRGIAIVRAQKNRQCLSNGADNVSQTLPSQLAHAITRAIWEDGCESQAHQLWRR